MPFDLAKKKKKKKRTPFDLDAALNEDGTADGLPSPAPEPKIEEKEEVVVQAEEGS